MPSRLNQNDSAAGLQARVQDALIPRLQGAARCIALGFLAVLDRVVKDDQIAAAAGERTAGADCEIEPAVSGPESVSRLGVFELLTMRPRFGGE